MIGFLDVVLRGLALAGQATAVGGVAFVLLVLRPGRAPRATSPAPSAARSLALVGLGALGLAAAQAGSVILHLAALADEAGWPVREALRTAYVQAALVRILASLALAVLALAARGARRGPPGTGARVALALSATVVGVSGSWLSHAAARLEGNAVLLALDALHQLGASAWIGGLAHLAAAAGGRGAPGWSWALLSRFSGLALAAVGVLVAAGVGLSVVYVDGPSGLLGTSYGVMVLTKVAMLLALLGLGAANFSAVRRLGQTGTPPGPRLSHFVEVELGLGLTVLFAAASLTSLPPAADVTADRATLHEVASRFTPRWPALTSPPLSALPIDDREAPRTDEDRAWSEYNHHVSGLFVLAMGVLAMVHRCGRAGWAAHWPLVFLGLAAFMLVRNDPGSWPLGPEGFWAGFAYTEVLQHRVFVLLVVVFGLFEWMVRTDRLPSRTAALVFPLLSVVGGALLLAHSHALANVKQEFLTEVTHAPLGLLALVVGWGRWLEVRLSPPAGRLAGWLGAIALAMVGLLLLLYRES